MSDIQSLLRQTSFQKEDVITLLSPQNTDDIETIRRHAERVLLRAIGKKVHYRGLVEFSNRCNLDCYYCGIRRSNGTLTRFSMSVDNIVDAAKWCAAKGYGSIVLQSGQRTGNDFIEHVVSAISRIKKETVSSSLPDGLGITLCVGEQSKETYMRFFNAGAHRYLLRIETTHPGLFSKIHPPTQTLEHRIECLNTLKEIGFMVGTGVMIGLPGQTIRMLADDILFFQQYNIDMIGMGPYLPHRQAPLQNLSEATWTTPAILQKALLMIAVCRILFKDINIAATTALQAIAPKGREEGLRYGANILMPQLTPTRFRKSYQLYENKPCLEESKGDCALCLKSRIESVDRQLAVNEWGDPHSFSH